MERIYTIPVNEKFEKTAEHPEDGCPICRLFEDLEENELDLILGASMMEPDIRIKTNEQGFCGTHFDMMLTRKNRLGLCLMLESHLDSVKKMMSDLPGSSLVGATGIMPMKRVHELNDSCYICSRIEHHLKNMIETVVLLWDTEDQFKRKFAAQPYFCLPHYSRLLDYARRRLSKKNFAAFYREAYGINSRYLETLGGDVSWFCKKFDYRYQDEPWNNSKDAAERAVKFLTGIQR